MYTYSMEINCIMHLEKYIYLHLCQWLAIDLMTPQLLALHAELRCWFLILLYIINEELLTIHIICTWNYFFKCIYDKRTGNLRRSTDTTTKSVIWKCLTKATHKLFSLKLDTSMYSWKSISGSSEKWNNLIEVNCDMETGEWGVVFHPLVCR